MTRSIYYSVNNGGDGSAYPHFFYDEKCAEVHQGLQREGFGEPCTGSITIHTRDYVEGQEILCSQAKTLEEYLEELKAELEYVTKAEAAYPTNSYYKGMPKVLQEAIDYLEGRVERFVGLYG
jgi:hypothetical protein